MILRILSVPELVFEAPELLSVGDDAAGLNGEVPNVTVILDNADGGLTELFVDPPLLAESVLLDGEVEQFRGRVRGVRLAQEITVELEA